MYLDKQRNKFNIQYRRRTLVFYLNIGFVTEIKFLIAELKGLLELLLLNKYVMKYLHLLICINIRGGHI